MTRTARAARELPGVCSYTRNHSISPGTAHEVVPRLPDPTLTKQVPDQLSQSSMTLACAAALICGTPRFAVFTRLQRSQHVVQAPLAPESKTTLVCAVVLRRAATAAPLAPAAALPAAWAAVWDACSQAGVSVHVGRGPLVRPSPLLSPLRPLCVRDGRVKRGVFWRSEAGGFWLIGWFGAQPGTGPHRSGARDTGRGARDTGRGPRRDGEPCGYRCC